MIQLRLKRKYLVGGWGKQCGFGTDDQGNKRRRKLTATQRQRIQLYEREAHVLHMGPTGKTRMVHR
jgi:hypothetical protein